jgi:hypothetical protein
MKKVLVLIVANLILFIVLRIITVLILFVFFGTGASEGNGMLFAPYIPLGIQLILLIFLYFKRKYLTKNVMLIILVVMTLILFYLGQMEIIPF